MDHSYLYSTRIENTFDEDQADIIAVLKQELAKNPKFEVRLINYYKGLPVSFPAKIIAIEKDIIDLDVYPQQSVAMAEHHYTFIRSHLLRHDLYAHVQYVNNKRRAASLRKLCYVEIMAERRNYLRLELDKPQHAHFMTSDGIVQGELKELSITGACMRIDQQCSLEINDEILLTFMLHNIVQNLDYNVQTPARLVRITGDALPRLYAFATTPDKTVDRQIAQYIFQRQVEIIHEIRDASELS
jgi:hypothetical protein